MKLKDIKHREIFRENRSLADASEKYKGILKVLEKRELPQEMIAHINKETETKRF